MYKILITKKAKKEIFSYKKSGKLVALKKNELFLSELEIHPKTGTGHPEELKHELSGYWSRRIDL